MIQNWKTVPSYNAAQNQLTCKLNIEKNKKQNNVGRLSLFISFWIVQKLLLQKKIPKV